MRAESDQRMATHATTNFLAGVIEGFYGPPWTPAERVELFDWMARWGLNTYFYAPKDDLNQRAIWRELYTDAQAGALGQLIQATPVLLAGFRLRTGWRDRFHR